MNIIPPYVWALITVSLILGYFIGGTCGQLSAKKNEENIKLFMYKHGYK